MEQDQQLTYDEFKAQCLRDIPAAQHTRWLAENEIVPATALPAGWLVLNKSEQDHSGGDRTGPDELQDYEHSKEIE